VIAFDCLIFPRLHRAANASTSIYYDPGDKQYVNAILMKLIIKAGAILRLTSLSIYKQMN